jgi:nitric oxide reductase subunit B
VAVRDRRAHFIAGILGTAHHYYWTACRATGCRSAGSSARSSRSRSSAWRCTPTTPCAAPGFAHPNRLALHWTIGSAIFTAFGAGLLGLAHTWPQVNRWTHGTLITPMHGHSAFFGAYVMIVLAVITYALPHFTGRSESGRASSACGRSGCRSAGCSA